MNTRTKQFDYYEENATPKKGLKRKFKFLLAGGFVFFLIKGIIWLLLLFGVGSFI